MRIWVARAEPAASRTAARLLALGHDPLLAPVLVVADTGSAPPSGPFDAVVITSANAVPPLAAAGLAAAPIFAVGTSTARAARTAGIVQVVAAGGDALSLAALVRDRLAKDARLLHVAGADRKPQPAEALRQAGYRLTVWTAYAAKPVAVLPSAVAAGLSAPGPKLDAALHYSRRSAEIALALATEAGCAAAFARLAHFCLSPDVAAPLVEAGIPAHFVPARPDEDGLLAGLPRMHG